MPEFGKQAGAASPDAGGNRRWTPSLNCAPWLVLMLAVGAHSGRAEPWRRHTVDDTSRGADGVRLADVNGDQLPDIATGWEEGGLIRAYLHPGPAAVRRAWPAVTVGHVRSPEDAVFADLDGDGSHDVVSCCEGANRTIYVHWAPREHARYLEPSAWSTQAVPCTARQRMWMFALPLQIDGRMGIDVLVGSKGANAAVGWLQSPENPRDVEAWKFHPLRPAGWIMSLIAFDLDQDGDQDLVVSDRKGNHRGVLWLENPGAKACRRGASWREHRLGGSESEVMFLTLCDLNGDGLSDILSATRNSQLLAFYRSNRLKPAWRTVKVANPFAIRNGKAVAVGDINLDGQADVVHTANTGGNRRTPGVVWMSFGQTLTDPSWQAHDISGSEGVKFDRVELVDLDRDGDLDVMTCEERDNLGVVWYENPHR